MNSKQQQTGEPISASTISGRRSWVVSFCGQLAALVLGFAAFFMQGGVWAAEPYADGEEITLGSLLPESMLPPDAAIQVALQKSPTVSDEKLSGLRGGFIFAGGLALDFAIEVATQLNGEIVSHTRLSTADGSIFDPGQLQTLLQLGPGNVLSPTAFANASGAITLIQNTLPNSLIQQVTTATLNVHNMTSARDHVMSVISGFAAINLP